MPPLAFPEIDPIIFSLGPLQVRWYGVMYLLGFLATYLLVKNQINRFTLHRVAAHFDNLNLVLILSVVVGGRLGYVLFYNFSYYLKNPMEIPATWSGGMSFHGACLAVIIGSWLYCRLKKIDFWQIADLYVVTFPIGLGLGRIGNFINGELYGRTTDVAWAMVFPGAGPLPRHPSQLYEAGLEGGVLFLLLWTVHRRPWRGDRYWPHGSIFALFLVGYGLLRSFVETFREPDSQLGYLFDMLTMGQLLSLAMVAAGVLLYTARLRRQSL